MKTSILLMLLWGLSCALPVARYQNTESKSSEERKVTLTMSVNPKLQAHEDPSDSTESEEHMGLDGHQYSHRPAGGLAVSGGKEGEYKDDDEDESGDDTLGDDDSGPGPEESNSRLRSGEDSADTTQSREDSAPQGEVSAQDTTSESRGLDNEDEVDSRPEGGDSTADSESEEPWVGGGSEGEGSHGDGSEFDDEGMQNDDPGTFRSEGSNSRISTVNLKSKESKGKDEEKASTQDSGESRSVGYASRKFFRKSRISEEGGRGELEDENMMEVKSDSAEAHLSQSWEHRRRESQQESKENESPEEGQHVQDLSSESSQEVDLPSQENSSESQEEGVGEPRGDNPDNITSHSKEDLEESDSSEESLDKPSNSESQSREDPADAESKESLLSSEESPESTEEENSSSQEEGLQAHSPSAETQSQESQSEQDSPSEEDDASDSQDSSKSKESNSTESTSSSEEEGQAKATEIESRKLTVDAYHNRPMGDQDDNDCQDGY
uniref:Dentin matrix acidic phosphoprotein 1 n=1 Tax=Sus scrofa TaxID=9823 RepID=A0A8D0UQN5_PIG